MKTLQMLNKKSKWRNLGVAESNPYCLQRPSLNKYAEYWTTWRILRILKPKWWRDLGWQGVTLAVRPAPHDISSHAVAVLMLFLLFPHHPSS